jgi:integrase/recombinase XerD
MQAEISAFLASLESHSSYSPSTRLAYGTDLSLFINYLRDTLQRSPTLSDFDIHQVSAFLEAERQEGLRLSTLLRRRASLQSFERYLQQEGYIHEKILSPDQQLIDKSSFHEQVQIQCLTLREVNNLKYVMSASKKPLSVRDYAILVLLLETGLSVSMLVSLNLTDLDLRSGCFHLALESNQDQWLPLGFSREPLADYIDKSRPELNPSPGEMALFISQNGIRMSRQSIWQILRNLGETAGLAVKLSPRLIRHTAALNLARAGRPISEIQLLLGHNNPMSTSALLHRLVINNPLG